MWEPVSKIIFFLYFTTVFCKIDEDFINQQVITTNTFAIWENATVPFYVDTDHFDHEQTMHILTALSMFAFKTCIKFMPVMAPPTTEDVLVFQNPDASRRCVINTHGHSVFRPHVVDLGYDCLKSPQIDMMIMKALGFTFEHNRISRDNYIEVLQENIEPGAIELFTKEDTLPMELRFLPYDINSVMHFDTREYSKNGHRTIIFKDHNAKQVRLGLTPTDLKKIEIIYGPHCRNRDRQEKIELCQSYPGVARKKREVEVEPVAHSIPQQTIKEEELVTKSLRVNPDITPPPESQKEEYDVMESFKDLGIDDEVQKIVENTYKIAELALKNARVKYCNGTEHVNPNSNHDINNTHKLNNRSSSDILGIIEVVGDYARDMVNNAMNNLTKFCEDSGNMEVYQRAKCDYGSGNRCPLFYRSTKSGYVKYSTQHRPVYYMSTKNHGNPYKYKHYGRSGNDTEDLAASRRKREAGNNTEVAANVTTDDKKVESNTVEKEKPNEVVSEKTTLEVKEKTVAPEEKKDAVGEKTENVEKKEESGKEKDKVIPLRMGTEPPAQKQYLYDRRFLKSNKRDLYESNNAKEEIPKKKKNPRDDREVNKKRRKSKKIAKERKTEELSKEDIKERPREEKRPRKGRQEKREREKEEIDHSKGNKERKRHRDREANKTPKEDVEKRKRPRNRKEKKQHREVKRPKNTDNVSKDQDESPKKHRNKNRDREDSENYYKEADAPKKHKKSQSNRETKESGLPETVPLSKANLEFYKERKWPDGTVYFMIQEDTTYDTNDLRRRIEEVNRILKKKTCVKLVEVTPGQANKYEDYIYIDNSPDYITGRVGGKQKFGSIEMFRGDQHRQHTAMMVMAMLGFYFEVGRHDRDEYVRVHMRHVRPDKLHHFEKIRSDATLPLPYDFASATHPAWQFWRQLGHSGISTVATFKEKDPDGKIMKSLGQNSKLLSDTDIIKINSVYGVKCFQKSRSVDEYSQMGNETVALPVE